MIDQMGDEKEELGGLVGGDMIDQMGDRRRRIGRFGGRRHD